MRTLLSRWTKSPSVAIPDPLWNSTLESLPFLARLTTHERSGLRLLTAQLLADKQMSAAGGLEMTSAMQVSIAVQACLRCSIWARLVSRVDSIVVYPRVSGSRSVTDDDGVVHEYVEPIAGEAWTAALWCCHGTMRSKVRPAPAQRTRW